MLEDKIKLFGDITHNHLSQVFDYNFLKILVKFSREFFISEMPEFTWNSLKTKTNRQQQNKQTPLGKDIQLKKTYHWIRNNYNQVERTLLFTWALTVQLMDKYRTG